MAHPTVGAAAAAAALFCVLLFACIVSFRLTRFRVYLLLGLSCAFRGAGYALRASNIDSFADGKAGSYLALSGAGFGISIAVLCLLLGCWWKNTDAGAAHRRLSVISRLFIAPIIALGPVGGCILAGLIYGDSSPGAMDAAEQLRYAIVWGLLAVLIILLLISLFATKLAWPGRRQQAAPHKASWAMPLVWLDPDLLAVVIVVCVLLLAASASFRVAIAYHHTLADTDDAFYPGQVLPELVELVVLLWPRLMPRAALGRRYVQWWQQTHGVPPPEAAGDEELAYQPSENASKAAGAELKAVS